MKLFATLFLIEGIFINTIEPDKTYDYLRYISEIPEENKIGHTNHQCVCEGARIGENVGDPRIIMELCAKLTLYTKNSGDGRLIDEKHLDGFDKGKKFVVLIHGWASTGHDQYVRIAKTFADKMDMNAIVVSWHRIAYNCYFAAASATNCVGKYIAKVLVKVVNTFGTNPDDIHLIGHSLGSHVAGGCGAQFFKLYKKKIGRITGLDPAKPYFTLLSFLKSLVKKDAKFVDVVHSCTDSILGTDRILGHIDIFVNGGSCYKQPHCKGKGIIGEPACAHSLVIAMVEYVVKNGPFNMKQCSGRDDTSERCSGSDSKWGSNEPKDASGKFFLQLDENINLEMS